MDGNNHTPRRAANPGGKENNMYVLQYRVREWDKWETMLDKFPTIKEAQAELENQPIKSIFRIAEEYTVTLTRYKAVK